MKKPILLIDGAHGIHVPMHFAYNNYDLRIYGLSDENQRILQLGPNNNDDYWDVWQWALDNVVIWMDNQYYDLYQDQDLWLIPQGIEPQEAFK